MMTGRRGSARFPLEIHEILRRSQAPNGNCFFRANYLLLCREAHSSHLIACSNRESQIVQLAIKKYRDPENFNLEEWLRVRNERATGYITPEEIEEVDLSHYIEL